MAAIVAQWQSLQPGFSLPESPPGRPVCMVASRDSRLAGLGAVQGLSSFTCCDWEGCWGLQGRWGGVSVAVCSQFSCPAHSPELYTCLHRRHARLLVPGPSPWVGLGWGSQRVQAGVFALPLLAKEVAISFPSFWVILCKM